MWKVKSVVCERYKNLADKVEDAEPHAKGKGDVGEINVFWNNYWRN